MQKVLGRSDDMVIIRVNVFPSMVALLISRVDSLSLVVDRKGTLDVLEVRVEVSEKVFPMKYVNLKNWGYYHQRIGKRLGIGKKFA